MLQIPAAFSPYTPKYRHVVDVFNVYVTSAPSKLPNQKYIHRHIHPTQNAHTWTESNDSSTKIATIVGSFSHFFVAQFTRAGVALRFISSKTIWEINGNLSFAPNCNRARAHTQTIESQSI